MSKAAKISRLLFEAREYSEMLYDIVKSDTGRSDESVLRYIREVDEYRASKGWDKDGFGGEKEPLPETKREEE